MKIQIRGRNIGVTKVVRTRVERRLGFALGRFGERIDRVLLRFSDANGERGDVDKRCQGPRATAESRGKRARTLRFFRCVTSKLPYRL